ncbi:MAG: hypothetical protein SGJ00_03675 [bacterium]|nr:hypothetical protein [bacterium]
MIYFFEINSVQAATIARMDGIYQCTTTPGVYNLMFKVYRNCQRIQLCANCRNGLSLACSIMVEVKGAASPTGPKMNSVFFALSPKISAMSQIKSRYFQNHLMEKKHRFFPLDGSNQNSLFHKFYHLIYHVF